MRLPLTVTAHNGLRIGGDAEGATLIQIAALLPPVVVQVLAHGPGALIVALVVALGWEAVFATRRGQRLGGHGATTAMIVAVMVPAQVATWQLALAISFGVVLGELIFGGRGFGFVSAAVATLAFLLFSFPGTVLAEPSVALALATLPGAVLLLALGLIHWQTLAAFAVVAGAWSTSVPIAPAALVFGTVFLVCDPIASAAIPLGRVLYGALAASLTMLFGADPAALVFAALLASIFAPLSDQIVLRILTGGRNG